MFLGHSPLSLPAACQKSLTGCQQLCSVLQIGHSLLECIVTSLGHFQLVLNMAAFSHWHSILTPTLLS